MTHSHLFTKHSSLIDEFQALKKQKNYDNEHYKNAKHQLVDAFNQTLHKYVSPGHQIKDLSDILSSTINKAQLLHEYNAQARQQQDILHQAWHIGDLTVIKDSSRQRDLITTQNFVEIVMKKFSNPDNYFLPLQNSKRFSPDSDNDNDISLQEQFLDAIEVDSLSIYFDDKELQTVFTALTDHNRSQYQAQYGNTTLANTHYRNDAYNYINQLFEYLKQATPLVAHDQWLSWKYVKIPRPWKSDVILGSYTQEWYISKTEKTSWIRWEVYDTDSQVDHSIDTMLTSINERSHRVRAIIDTYQNIYNKNTDNDSKTFRKNLVQKLAQSIKKIWWNLYHTTKAQQRLIESKKTTNYVNSLGIVHGMLNDLRREVERGDAMIDALSRYRNI